jgi:hypothetical protein
MMDRCRGLPILTEHPTRGLLTSREFADRCVGTVVYAFLQDDCLRGVARILDKTAIEILQDGADTSPGVQFAPGTSKVLTLDMVERCSSRTIRVCSTT